MDNVLSHLQLLSSHGASRHEISSPGLIQRFLAWVKVLPFPGLPRVPVCHELVVGLYVGEVIWIIQVRLREYLRLLVGGTMGHAIKVIQVWHLCLIVMRLKERNKVLVRASS